MASLEQVCGYKDLNGKFHDTLEQTETENKKIVEFNLRNEIYEDLLEDTFSSGFQVVVYSKYLHTPLYCTLQDFIWKYPNAICKACLKVLRYKFKEKWNNS